MSSATVSLQQATIRQYAKRLELATIAGQFVAMAEQAIKEKQSHLNYLEVMLGMEVEERERNTVARRITEAHFPFLVLGLSPHFHRKFGVRIAQERRLATRSTQVPPVLSILLVFFRAAESSGVTCGAVKGAPEGAFILTLDSPASHFTIELGTKRNAVQLSFVP